MAQLVAKEGMERPSSGSVMQDSFRHLHYCSFVAVHFPHEIEALENEVAVGSLVAVVVLLLNVMFARQKQLQ